MIRYLTYGAAFLAVFVSTIWVAAGGFRTAQERQVTYRYLSEALSHRPQRSGRVTWLAEAAPLDRDFTPADGQLIGRALDEVWRLHAAAQETGNTAPLSDRFSGVALDRAVLSVGDAQDHGGRMVVLSQAARPVFFHKDGSLFQADLELTVARYLSQDGDLTFFTLTRETGIATLMNEANGWRLFSYERRTSEDLESRSVAWSGTVRGVNYYPAEAPWRAFWAEFDAKIIAEDFDRLRALGANSIRVFLTYDDFLAEDPETSLQRLDRMLALAAEKGISVVPTLFDLKQDFGLATWADDTVYLERVLPVLARSRAVEFIDLKNEPDLDFESHGQAKILAWLQAIYGVVRQADTGRALTVGWSAAGAATHLAEGLDVISYHEYGPVKDTASNLAAVRAVAGSKPVVVSEIGTSAYELTASFPGSEDAQANDIEARIDALEGADGVMIWTLNDFSEVDASVVGPSPWVGALQGRFGLFRLDGSEKPAARAVRSLWAETAVYPEG